MTCRELIDFLMAYLDGELPAERRAVFDEHLEVCAACQRYLESYQQSIALGRAACDADAPDAPVAGDVPEELVQAILAARSARGS
jgi:anti-sigma factor RsiW